jgi:hypothetical protein
MRAAAHDLHALMQGKSSSYYRQTVRHRGAPIKQRVLADLPDPGAQLSDRFWQSFKQGCAANGNVLPKLLSQLEAPVPPWHVSAAWTAKAEGRRSLC